MRALLILGFTIEGLRGGCATSNKSSQVQELGSGTYGVGLSRVASSGVSAGLRAKLQ